MESAVVPNNSDPSRLNIELVYGERIEDVDVEYYYDGHFAGKTALTLTGRREEIAVSEKGENLGGQCADGAPCKKPVSNNLINQPIQYPACQGYPYASRRPCLPAASMA